MKNSKKSAVGVVKVSMLLSGDYEKTNSVLNAKIVVYYLPIIDQNSELKIDLFGLKNGF